MPGFLNYLTNNQYLTSPVNLASVTAQPGNYCRSAYEQVMDTLREIDFEWHMDED